MTIWCSEDLFEETIQEGYFDDDTENRQVGEDVIFIEYIDKNYTNQSIDYLAIKEYLYSTEEIERAYHLYNKDRPYTALLPNHRLILTGRYFTAIISKVEETYTNFHGQQMYKLTFDNIKVHKKLPQKLRELTKGLID